MKDVELIVVKCPSSMPSDVLDSLQQLFDEWRADAGIQPPVLVVRDELKIELHGRNPIHETRQPDET